jgi:hypothetical protein
MQTVWFCHFCMRAIEDNFRATVLYLQAENGTVSISQELTATPYLRTPRMPDSMVEILARALHAEECRAHCVPVDDWNGLADGRRRLFRDQARAVLIAIREPTEGMAANGADVLPRNLEANHQEVAKDVWRAMIAAALTEGA